MAGKSKFKIPKPIIRGLEPTDLDALAELHQLPEVVAGTAQIPHQSAAAWKERIGASRPEDVRSLVLVVENRVVGMASLLLPNARRFRERHSAGVTISVHPDYQGRGYGGMLLDALVELAEKWCGFLRLELDVYVDNTRAIRMYRSRGFAVEGLRRAYVLRDGKLVDAFAMARVAENLPWPRVTAEDSSSRALPQLPSPKKRNPSAN